eukprot:5706919-Lingulodinium_polyedra.AAC.1
MDPIVVQPNAGPTAGSIVQSTAGCTMGSMVNTAMVPTVGSNVGPTMKSRTAPFTDFIANSTM